MASQLIAPAAVTLVDDALQTFFADSTRDARAVAPSYELLWRSLHDLFNSGGKRLRSTMFLLAYDAFGGEDIDRVTPVAAAQELLHFSLLIHDDVIDRDYVRYGVANIAGRYKVSYSKYVASASDGVHYAHSAAILAGDLMLSAAHQLIATSELTDSDKRAAGRYLSRGVFDVAGGELLDTELSFTPYKPGDALTVARYKTGSYSFVSPLLCGAALGGASQVQLSTLTELAESLGIAYQLTDDLLGMFGDETVTGKSTIGDIVEGKRTFLIEQTLNNLASADKTAFMLGFGNPRATTLEVDHIRQLVEKSGARKSTERYIDDCCRRATAALDKLDLDQAARSKFETLITKVTQRSY